MAAPIHLIQIFYLVQLWVYDMSEGLLKSPYKLEPGSDIDDSYRFDFSSARLGVF